MVDFKFISSSQKKGLIFILVIVIALGSARVFMRKKINDEGVYLKGTVIDRGGYKGGIITTVKYTFKGKSYQNIVHSENGREKVGDQYFIKVLSNDPNELLFLESNPVPQCLLDSVSPYEGWGQLPECNN
jgi:hypothetical protein